jgi:hypothetical protein
LAIGVLLGLVQQFEPALLELRVGERDRQRRRRGDMDNACPEALVAVHAEARSVASDGEAQERFGRLVRNTGP